MSVSGARASRGAAARPAASSPFDAQAALEHLLARLRASSGATRVSIWVYEAFSDTAVPFRHVAADSSRHSEHTLQLRTPLPLARSPFLASIIRRQQPLVARADGRRAPDKELAERGVGSAYGEPLLVDGEVVGVLTVEPAAAAAPHLLRQAAPRLAAALAETWTRRAEKRRTAQAEVLLSLIESASHVQSMDDLLGTACRQLAELGEVERACIFLLEDGRLVPRMAGYADGRRDGAGWEAFRDAAVDLPLAQAVLRSGGPVTADRDSGLLSGWWVDHFGVASCLAVPLGRTPGVVGVLTLDSPEAHPFSEDVRRLAAAAGAHLGGVICQARTSAAQATSLATAGVVRQLLVDGSSGATGVAEALTLEITEDVVMADAARRR
jgi:transcriptional regulator with GAF, ATPase, and Fis domain